MNLYEKFGVCHNAHPDAIGMKIPAHQISLQMDRSNASRAWIFKAASSANTRFTEIYN
jgi:hypothetical protein